MFLFTPTTLYDYNYRKSSKPGVKIAEPRPACDGIDSKSAMEMSSSRPVSGRSAVSVRAKSKSRSSSSGISGSSISSPDEEDEADEGVDSLE